MLLAIIDAAVCFFFTYYSVTTRNIRSVTDVYSVGKAAFIALLGTVTLEVPPYWLYDVCLAVSCLLSRTWTPVLSCMHKPILAPMLV